MSNSNNQNGCCSMTNDFNCCNSCGSNNSNSGCGCSWIWILVILVIFFCFCNN